MEHVQPLWVRVDPRVIAMKGCSTHKKKQKKKNSELDAVWLCTGKIMFSFSRVGAEKRIIFLQRTQTVHY